MLSRPFRSSFLCLPHQSFSVFFVCFFCHLFCFLSPHQYLPVLDCLSLCLLFPLHLTVCLLFIILSFLICFSLFVHLSPPHHLTVSVSFCLCGFFLLLFFLLCFVLSSPCCLHLVSQTSCLSLTLFVTFAHYLLLVQSLLISFYSLFYRIVIVNILCVWGAQTVHRGILHFWRKYSITWHLLETVQTTSAK